MIELAAAAAVVTDNTTRPQTDADWAGWAMWAPAWGPSPFASAPCRPSHRARLLLPQNLFSSQLLHPLPTTQQSSDDGPLCMLYIFNSPYIRVWLLEYFSLVLFLFRFFLCPCLFASLFVTHTHTEQYKHTHTHTQLFLSFRFSVWCGGCPPHSRIIPK